MIINGKSFFCDVVVYLKFHFYAKKDTVVNEQFFYCQLIYYDKMVYFNNM